MTDNFDRNIRRLLFGPRANPWVLPGETTDGVPKDRRPMPFYEKDHFLVSVPEGIDKYVWGDERDDATAMMFAREALENLLQYGPHSLMTVSWEIDSWQKWLAIAVVPVAEYFKVDRHALYEKWFDNWSPHLLSGMGMPVWNYTPGEPIMSVTEALEAWVARRAEEVKT